MQSRESLKKQTNKTSTKGNFLAHRPGEKSDEVIDNIKSFNKNSMGSYNSRLRFKKTHCQTQKITIRLKIH